MRSLDESVQRLDELASRLNQATDKLNDQIEAVEQRLSATRIGLEVWLGDDRIPADPLRESETDFFTVGWTKLGEGWRLAARKTEFSEFSGDWNTLDPQPLTNAPRHVRMQALPLVLNIVERLGNEAERWLRDVEHAINGSPAMPPAPELPLAEDDIPF